MKDLKNILHCLLCPVAKSVGWFVVTLKQIVSQGTGPTGRVPILGVFLWDPKPYLRGVLEKTMENSAQLGRQE